MSHVSQSDAVDLVESPLVSRRSVLGRAGSGFGLLGLTGLLQREGLLSYANSATGPLADRAMNPLSPQNPHFAPKATRVIWIFANGGPSHVDTWNHRPALDKWNGKSIKKFDSGFENTTGFFKNSVGNLMQSPFKFTPQGEC